MENERYFVPDGYNQDGTEKEMREVKLISVTNGVAKFEYIEEIKDTTKVDYCFYDAMHVLEKGEKIPIYCKK